MQPHLDDVAFACGGRVARAADEGEHPVVVGVFTGPPNPGPLGANLVELHTKWGLGDDAWLARRHEDERACAILGAVPRWLPFQDAPYRGYSTFASIFDPISEDDPLISQIANELVAIWQQSQTAVVHMPLGIGAHIDHQLCHAAGRVLEAEGVPVRYYEDFPYAALPGLVSARLTKLRDAFVPELVDITAWIERRVQAAESYVSQVKGLFTPTSLIGGTADQVMRRHAGALAGGLSGYIERGPRFAECFYRRSSHGG
ncbi:MAG: LmbE family protein [Myxococcales bacterium]|nr:LmbE family protein [Myxococcales bacterium]